MCKLASLCARITKNEIRDFNKLAIQYWLDFDVDKLFEEMEKQRSNEISKRVTQVEKEQVIPVEKRVGQVPETAATGNNNEGGDNFFALL